MEVKAPISSNYRWRIFGVGLMCLGFAGWFLYDGFVAYPKHAEMYAAYHGLNPSAVSPGQQDDQMGKWEHMAERKGWPVEPPEDKDSEAYLYYYGTVDRNEQSAEKRAEQVADYEALALQRGWPTTEPPTKYNHSSTDYLAQKILGFLCLPFGLWFAYIWIASGGRWIGLDGNTLVASNGQRVDIDNITEIDSSRWKTKGIAWVHYNDESGEQRFLIDDWKYERKPTVQIYNAVAGTGEDESTVDAAKGSTSENPEDASTTESHNNAENPNEQEESATNSA